MRSYNLGCLTIASPGWIKSPDKARIRRLETALKQILDTPIHILADVITVKAIAENALKVESE